MDLQSIAPPQDHPSLHSHYNKPLTQPTDKMSTHRRARSRITPVSKDSLGVSYLWAVHIEICIFHSICRVLLGRVQKGHLLEHHQPGHSCLSWLLWSSYTAKKALNPCALQHRAPQHKHSWSSTGSGNLANHLVTPKITHSIEITFTPEGYSNHILPIWEDIAVCIQVGFLQRFSCGGGTVKE